MTDQTFQLNEIQQIVRDRYAAAAIAASTARTVHEVVHGSPAAAPVNDACCDDGCCGPSVSSADAPTYASGPASTPSTDAGLLSVAELNAAACCTDGCCSDV